MAYDFYLGETLLPVPPSQLQIKVKNQNKTITLINEGEVNLLKGAGLSEISFTALIPQMKYPFARYLDGFKGAGFFLDLFEKLKNEKKPFQFIVSRALPGYRTEVDFGNEEEVFKFHEKSLFGTNTKVSMEDYKIVEDAGNGFDVKVDITLKQFRPYGTKTVEIKAPTPEQPQPVAHVQETRPAESAPQPRTHTVVKGDSLWAIAQKYLNDGNRYPEIYSLNQTVIDARNKGTGLSKHTIYPGQVFTLPS